jgi:cob(I)alamin adenosyltransferase
MIKKDISWQKGYVQVYTGDGKGKTTAAFGLAMRAAGAGLPVFIGQFVKGMKYSEINAFQRFSGLITVKQYGRRCFIDSEPERKDIQKAKDGLEDVHQALDSGKFKVVILDEANIAVYFKLFSADDLLELIDSKPDDVELVITGRYADPKVMQRADLITDMREIKHYYAQGVTARNGIER